MHPFSCRLGGILLLGATLPAQSGTKPPPPAPAATAATAVGPVFRDGQAQEVEAFKDRRKWIREQLWVEADFDSDGNGRNDRLHVDVTRPAQTADGLRVATIYETSPYYSGVSSAGPGSSAFWNPNHEIGAKPPARTTPPPIPFARPRAMISNSHVETWVKRGFAVVHSESPGTGRSEGCPSVGGRNESLAPKAVIDWLCGRAEAFRTIDGTDPVIASWCTGKVGMIGTSYNGTLPLAAATTGVEGLEAIIPIAPNTSYYHYYRSHGLVRHPGGYMGEDIDVLYDFIHSGDPARRDYCDKKYRDEMNAKQDRLTGDYNAFWASRNYRVQLGKVRAAVLMAHAFNDWNVMPEHSVEVYATLKQLGVPSMAFFHQGGHGGPPPLRLMNMWFSRYLYGVRNDVENEPRSWVVRAGKPRSRPTPYAEYPHPKASAVMFYPAGDGNGVGTLGPDRATDSEPQNIVDDAQVRGAKLASAETSKHRLLFATTELQEALHVSGTASVQIRMASSKPAANLSVWLVSLPWKDRGRITDNIITRGWADPQNRVSSDESEPLEPGRFYTVQFTLQPDDQVIAAGQRIGLMIFSSDHDFTLHPPAGTELRVDLNQTSLSLPVVGGPTGAERALGK